MSVNASRKTSKASETVLSSIAAESRELMRNRLARLELAAIRDHDRLPRLAALRADLLDRLHHVVALHHVAEDHVLPVQVRRLRRADEELRAVRVRPRVRHRQAARAGVLARLAREGLIRELGAVDRLAAGAVAAREVAALAHEARDHAVERAALEVQRLAALAGALLTRAQRTEVLRRLRHRVREELHDDAPGALAADGHVEVDLRVRHRAEIDREARATL